MQFLVDGHNLLFKTGMVPLHPQGNQVEQARAQMVAWIAKQLGKRAAEITLVFDARKAIGRRNGIDAYKHIRIHFAHTTSADTLIADLLSKSNRPQPEVTVVSDDTEVRDTGIIHGCRIWHTVEFIDYLNEPTDSVPKRKLKPGSDKPIDETDEDRQELLRRFTDR